MSDKKKTAIAISGRGSNMQALIEAAKEPDFPAVISLIVSDHKNAEGLKTAQQANIKVWKTHIASFDSKKDFEKALSEKLLHENISILCLAGYMRLLGADFIRQWQGKILNIHPSLLPAFPGLDTHRRVLEAREPYHGCTVHFVDQGIDSGPIITQTKIIIDKNDTIAQLAARVLHEEHQLYPKALRWLAEEKISFSNPRTEER